MYKFKPLRASAGLLGLSLNLFGASLLTSCAEDHQPDAAAIKHDVGQPTRNSQAWNWVAASANDYVNTIAPLIQIDASALLPSSHQLTKRVQMWIDKVDTQLRTSYPQKLANVPKPQAMVVIDRTANAFVAPAPVCYNIGVKVADGTPTARSTAERVYLDAQTGELSAFPSDFSCINGPAGSANMQAFANDFNAASSGCQFKVQGTGAQATLVPNAACRIASDLNGTVRGKNVVILQTASWVTVHTGIFSLMDEDAFVAVLAHELGHYYRSHLTAHESTYGYYYTLDARNPDHRPVAEPGAKAAGDSAFAAATLLTSNEYYTPMAGQRTRSELFFAVGSLLRKAAAISGASPACKAAWTLASSESFSTAMSRFPFAPSDGDMTTAYSGFEAKARACLATLTVKASGDVSASGASWAAFRGLVTRPVWPAWLGSVSPGTLQMLAGLLDAVASRLGAAPAVGTTWDQAVDAMTSELKRQDDAGIAALKTAHDRRIGQYTIEQEADEEAAEWISQLGFDPKSAVDAMHALIVGVPTSLYGLSLGETDCNTLYNRNWLDAQGNYQFVPIGDFAEIHHSTCYRMFNLSREITAHREVASGASLPEYGGRQWKALQTAADEAGNGQRSAGRPQPRGMRQLPTFVKNSHAFDCVYASQYRL